MAGTRGVVTKPRGGNRKRPKDRRRMNVETTTTRKEEDEDDLKEEKRTKKLVCVKIPSEDLNPFEEVVFRGVRRTKLGDVLPELLKPHFMGRRRYRRELGAPSRDEATRGGIRVKITKLRRKF